MSLPAGDDLAHFRYDATEYFVSGTANGMPYKTRIVVRRPSANSRFSGIVLAESMHPSGNAWMFHFTHTYTMTSGHIGVEIVTSDPAQLVEFNEARYKDLRIQPGQASEIIAQVGALIRSSQPGNPLAGLPVRKMILAGTSASAGVLINYLPAHMVYRLGDMKPIYDGFLPTSNGANIRPIDVPMIQVPTTTEAMRGGVPTRQDGDMPGDQFRVYEFAGMAHLDTRDVEAFRPNPCKYPISLFPLSAYMSVALHHLVQWIDTGTVAAARRQDAGRSQRRRTTGHSSRSTSSAIRRAAFEVRTSTCRSRSTEFRTRAPCRRRRIPFRGWRFAARRASISCAASPGTRLRWRMRC